ncbi:unnamed protein product [Medioppia subpectinata]|uniref:Phosphatidylcholine transfer protein n=1 Tax=Medioppia subpectinata TaxID=1979941 RepID=A0A7R9PW88_9ACAR|nr:unnamed protein product [Medioppia subpectinata]CAG2103060.1 unnamed protein product [Medioppia subpectinata]
MFLATNHMIANQFRTQTLLRQRLQSLNATGGQALRQRLATNGVRDGRSVWDQLRDELNAKVILFVTLLRQQSNVYMSLRLRRMAQICGLYNRIYSESTVNKLMSQMLIRLKARALQSLRNRLSGDKKANDSIKCLMSAVCGLFCWDSQRITDGDLRQTIRDFETVQRVGASNRIPNNDNMPKSTSFSVSAETHSMNDNDGQWEAVIMRDDFKLWRKAIPNTSLYQYKVFGTFNDIPARSFFRVQMDTEYRKKWDKLVIKLDIIEKEPFFADKDQQSCEDSGNQVLHWIMKYPYPMNTRDYVYLRRARIDIKQNLMVLVSKAIEFPKLPETTQHVRVVDYSSQMVIKPHTSFDECGFDYLLTYFDDPRAAFPSPAYNWMAVSGVPDFVQKLHSAALQLYTSNNHKSNLYSCNGYTGNSSSHSSECFYA